MCQIPPLAQQLRPPQASLQLELTRQLQPLLHPTALPLDIDTWFALAQLNIAIEFSLENIFFDLQRWAIELVTVSTTDCVIYYNKYKSKNYM